MYLHTIILVQQITVKRLRGIQDKIVEGRSLEDGRGKHTNRKIIATEEVKALMYAHLLKIPSRKSHYTRSKMRYFTNPNLTVKKLYFLFREYYREKKGEALRMTIKHYYKLFQRVKFAVASPLSDQCNVCETLRIKLVKNPTDNHARTMKRLHRHKYKRYQSLKREILKNIPADTLCLEFDYAQNLPLPSLTINKQFYLRLLWFHNINIHSHHDKDSSFYTFYEYEAKKDANSVVSFVNHFLTQKGVFEEGSQIKKLIFFSDNAGGQNKNSTFIQYCGWISKVYGLQIEHIFPVPGHSFSICDSNFGTYGAKARKLAPVTSSRPYLDLFRSARIRPKPFNVINDPSIISDYASMFQKSGLFCDRPKTFKIRSYVRFRFANGVLSASPSYFGTYKPFQIVRRICTRKQFPNITPTPPGLKVKKAKDILSLLPFVENEDDVA